MMHQSRVAWLTEKQRLEFRDEALDDAGLASDAVFAQTLYSCISPGTERAAYMGMPPLRPMRAYPRLIGYCNIAKVLAAGAEADGIKAGDIIYNHQPHRSHFICRASRITAVLDRAAERNTLINLTPMYLYHLSYNALLKSGFFPGMRVAVGGLGCLGLTTLQLLSAFSTPATGLTRRDPDRFASYRNAQCEIVNFDDVGDKTSFDIIIITSNTWADWKRALELARKGGTIASLSFPGRGDRVPDYNPLDSQYTYDKQLNLIFCGYTPDLAAEPWDIRFTLKRNCRYLLDLIAAERLASAKLISVVGPWHELGKVYESLADRRNDMVTAVLDWTTGG